MTADELPQLKPMSFTQLRYGQEPYTYLANSVKARETAIAEELELIRNLDDKDKMDGALYLLIEKLKREK